MSRKASLEVITHRLLFPQRDVREVVKTDPTVLSAECLRSTQKQPERSKVNNLLSMVQELSIHQLKYLHSKLKEAGIRGPSTYAHLASCIKLTEYELETKAMRTDSRGTGTTFALELCSGDMTSPIIHLDATPSSRLHSCHGPQKGRERAAASHRVELDEKQRVAADASKRTALTLINAGPGTGKTLTLCILAEEIMREIPSSKILFLSFTVKAQDLMTKRMKDMGAGDVLLKADEMYHSPGLCILTFDKYAYSLTKQTFDTYEMGKQDALRRLRSMASEGLRLFDYLLVDESQDLSSLEFQMMRCLRDMCGKTVLAGDPRQEVFSDCGHFSRLWCISVSGRGVQKVHLTNNYRSCICIVDALNNFARIHFASIGGLEEQVSMRGDCSEVEMGEECVKVFDCKNMNVVGRSIAAHLSTRSLEEAYVISPMTCKAYNMDTVQMSISSDISESTHTATNVGRKRPRRTGGGKQAPNSRNVPTVCTSIRWRGRYSVPLRTGRELQHGPLHQEQAA